MERIREDPLAKRAFLDKAKERSVKYKSKINTEPARRQAFLDKKKEYFHATKSKERNRIKNAKYVAKKKGIAYTGPDYNSLPSRPTTRQANLTVASSDSNVASGSNLKEQIDPQLLNMTDKFADSEDEELSQTDTDDEESFSGSSEESESTWVASTDNEYCGSEESSDYSLEDQAEV